MHLALFSQENVFWYPHDKLWNKIIYVRVVFFSIKPTDFLSLEWQRALVTKTLEVLLCLELKFFLLNRWFSFQHFKKTIAILTASLEMLLLSYQYCWNSQKCQKQHTRSFSLHHTQWAKSGNGGWGGEAVIDA